MSFRPQRFGAPEVARAKTLKAVGFPWRPQVGDWFINHVGYCELVKTLDQAERLGSNGAVFLPNWEDCRAWLQRSDWGHPELMDESDGEVSMLLTHSSGRLIRVNGASDLDCLYRAILTIVLSAR
ncbi:MAG: hypothetical protein ACI9OJ_005995 [Myxococcota bacterium]|jgi:hypothetical protein